MSEILQWVIVGLAVIVAAVYLIRRLGNAKKGCGGCDCGACPFGADYVEKCGDSHRP